MLSCVLPARYFLLLLAVRAVMMGALVIAEVISPESPDRPPTSEPGGGDSFMDFRSPEGHTMPRKAIGRAKELGDAPLHAVKTGRKNILLARVGKEYFALGNICTHDKCWLSGGKLEGDTVRCRCHGSVFNVKTGAVVHGPAERPEPVFSVTEAEGELFIDL